MTSGKTCFVISPIGEDKSPERRQADCVLQYVIAPAVEAMGYARPVRVDMLDKPTHITTEIVERLLSADLVIADLSGSNPNVFYELGIRHTSGKPVIMLSDWNERPPFDVGHNNIIRYTHDDPNSHKTAIERIKGQIKQMHDGAHMSTPVSLARGLTSLEVSGDDKDQVVANLVKQVDELSGRLSSLESADFVKALASRAIADAARRSGNNHRNYLSHVARGAAPDDSVVINALAYEGIKKFSSPPDEGN